MRHLIIGFAAIFVILVVWYMMSPAVEEIATFVEDESAENSIARDAGSNAYTVWTIIGIVAIILVIAWMFVWPHRQVEGAEYTYRGY